MNALQEFTYWLPGELAYAGTKKNGGYESRERRARLGAEDGSMHRFLGTEWDYAHLLRDQGALYKPFHGMSAQLQFAKFAAGLVDKIGALYWIESGAPDDEKDPKVIASVRARTLILDEKPWKQSFDISPQELRDKHFEETPFSEGVLTMQRDFVEVADTIRDGRFRPSAMLRAIDRCLDMSGLATQCYVDFADQYLEPGQLVIPVSQHTK